MFVREVMVKNQLVSTQDLLLSSFRRLMSSSPQSGSRRKSAELTLRAFWVSFPSVSLAVQTLRLSLMAQTRRLL